MAIRRRTVRVVRRPTRKVKVSTTIAVITQERRIGKMAKKPPQQNPATKAKSSS